MTKKSSIRWASRPTTNHVADDKRKLHLLHLFNDEIKVGFPLPHYFLNPMQAILPHVQLYDVTGCRYPSLIEVPGCIGHCCTSDLEQILQSRCFSKAPGKVSHWENSCPEGSWIQQSLCFEGKVCALHILVALVSNQRHWNNEVLILTMGFSPGSFSSLGSSVP